MQAKRITPTFDYVALARTATTGELPVGHNRLCLHAVQTLFDRPRDAATVARACVDTRRVRREGKDAKVPADGTVRIDFRDLTVVKVQMTADDAP